MAPPAPFLTPDESLLDWLAAMAPDVHAIS
jgi:hypothetical protein